MYYSKIITDNELLISTKVIKQCSLQKVNYGIDYTI